MKKTYLLILCLVTGLSIFSQSNLSGSYGYQRNPPENTGNDKDAKGASGNLVLLKMEGNKYRFWLDVSIGWPTYNTGETDGTITIVNDTASFDNTHEDAMNACMLHFSVMNNTIHISGHSASYNCGFGDGVNADGDYTRLKTQPALNNAWLKKEYFDAPSIIVTSAKTELFQDETFLHPFVPKQYFNKGDKLLGVGETKDAYYTEFINPQGKLIYGWIKKSTVKKTAAD